MGAQLIVEALPPQAELLLELHPDEALLIQALAPPAGLGGAFGCGLPAPVDDGVRRESDPLQDLQQELPEALEADPREIDAGGPRLDHSPQGLDPFRAVAGHRGLDDLRRERQGLDLAHHVVENAAVLLRRQQVDLREHDGQRESRRGTGAEQERIAVGERHQRVHHDHRQVDVAERRAGHREGVHRLFARPPFHEPERGSAQPGAVDRELRMGGRFRSLFAQGGQWPRDAVHRALFRAPLGTGLDRGFE